MKTIASIIVRDRKVSGYTPKAAQAKRRLFCKVEVGMRVEERIGHLHEVFMSHLLQDPDLREALPYPFLLVALDIEDRELVTHIASTLPTQLAKGETPSPVYAIFHQRHLVVVLTSKGVLLPKEGLREGA